MPTSAAISRRPRRPVRLAACRSILVVKLDFIGDYVLTIPFLENLRRNAPQALITLVVIDRAFPFAATSPAVDRVISISSADGRRIVFGGLTVADIAGFRRDYLGGAFDLALVPRWDVDFNGALQIAWASGAPRVAGFTERATPRKALLNRGDDRFYTDLVVDRRSVHEVEHTLALLEALGGTAASREARLAIRPPDREEGRALLDAMFGGKRRPVLAVAPFLVGGARQYPPDRLAPIVRRLAHTFDLDVLVVGGGVDAARGEAFAAAVGRRARSSLGRLTPLGSAAVVGDCVAFIGMDSGPAHLAAAVGTPVIVLSNHARHGSADHATSPARFAPWGPPAKVLVLQPDAALPPCREGCEAGEPHCILQLDEEQVWADLEEFVGVLVGARTILPPRRLPGRPA